MKEKVGKSKSFG